MIFKRKRRGMDHKRKLITKLEPLSPVSEQFKAMRTNIQFATVDMEMRTLMITSAIPGEGKSTTVSNTAVTFAQEGKRVLLVDADMRKPAQHDTFFVTNTFGLTSILMKQISLLEAVKKSGVNNLSILTSGPIPPNPAELLNSKGMDDFLQEALQYFDLILFDTPPVLAVTDAQVLANKCDGTILVVSSEITEKAHARKAKELLLAARAKILGVVVNNKKMAKKDNYPYYRING